MIVGGALFGIFAGVTFWFPKITGFRLDERLGKIAFWFWFVGFFVSFIPLYFLGFMGATRRLDHYASSTGWQPFYITSAIGFAIILCGIAIQVIQILYSVRNRQKLRDDTGDPWDGRTLEWSVPSPPPFYSFAVIPTVHDREEFWEMKKRGKHGRLHYEDIELPKNTGMGVYISGFGFLFGFAAVWHILWMAVLGIGGVIACMIIRSLDKETEYVLPAEEVKRMEAARTQGSR